MKKFLLLLLICASFSTFVGAQIPTALIKRAITLPKLDGVIDACWDTIVAHKIDNPRELQNPTLGVSGSTYWKSLWTTEGLYVLIKVNDNVFFPAYKGIHPDASWEYDKPEIYFDVNQILKDGGKWGSGHYQIAPAFVEGMTNGEEITAKDNMGSFNIKYAFKVTDPSYVGEYFIPWEMKDKDGKLMDLTREIGFDVCIIDADVEGGNDQAWWSQFGETLDNAGIITFDVSGDEIFANEIKVTSIAGVSIINTDNGTLQMQADVLPADTWNKVIIWTMNDGTGSASISKTGLVTALKDGEVTVVASTVDGFTFGEMKLTISGQKGENDINLALFKTVTTSSIENIDNNGSFATDGLPKTRWASEASDPQWICVDLGATYHITRVLLNWEAAFASGYSIQVSNDTISWTDIYSTTSGLGAIEDITNLSGTGRYVRMYGTKRGSWYAYSLYEIEVYGDVIKPNIALNKPAKSSSNENVGNDVKFAFDGLKTTRWASVTSDPQWISVDLGQTYDISGVLLSWEGAFGSAYKIQVSNDATSWTDIYTTTTGLGGIENITNLSGTGRYVRMYGTARGTWYGYSLYEMEVYGDLAKPNIALNKPATSSSIENIENDGKFAFDGLKTSRWASVTSDPQWISVDLGNIYKISGVLLNWEGAYGSAYKLQVSNDDISWTDIYSTTTGIGGIEKISNLSGTGRYVRMHGTARGTWYGYSLYEMEVYGELATAISTVEAPKMSIYPNPVQTELTVSKITVANSMVFIYNVRGQKLMEKTADGNMVQFNVSSLNKGIYFVKLSDGSSQKFIK